MASPSARAWQPWTRSRFALGATALRPASAIGHAPPGDAPLQVPGAVQYALVAGVALFVSALTLFSGSARF